MFHALLMSSSCFFLLFFWTLGFGFGFWHARVREFNHHILQWLNWYMYTWWWFLVASWTTRREQDCEGLGSYKKVCTRIPSSLESLLGSVFEEVLMFQLSSPISLVEKPWFLVVLIFYNTKAPIMIIQRLQQGWTTQNYSVNCNL